MFSLTAALNPSCEMEMTDLGFVFVFVGAMPCCDAVPPGNRNPNYDTSDDLSTSSNTSFQNPNDPPSPASSPSFLPGPNFLNEFGVHADLIHVTHRSPPMHVVII